MAALLVVVALCGSAIAQPQPDGRPRYDVAVAGSEPEAVAAAVAAAESGARTVLLSEDPRVGGLFTLGWLNVLDLRTQPVNLQQGLFERWWRRVGRGHAFDVVRAEAAFRGMLDEAGVEVRTGTAPLAPIVRGGRVVGISAGNEAFLARHTIDGTAEMELAAAAGASHSFGWRSLGHDARMVDTLVFRIEGVDWRELQRGIRARGRDYAVVDDRVAWGHFGGYPAAYKASAPGVRLRGLNLGLQDDGTVLVNALLIHGIEPFDEQSLAEGRARAEAEAPLVVEYLTVELPGFEEARFSGSAPRLYVRETRHLEALCTLSADDVLDNRVTGMDVAAGGYPLDVQALTPHDSGYVFGSPEIYGVRLCVNVPQDVGGLWVVGKAAGYDPIAASSARVVPFGMSLAEAVGVAAARGAREGLEPAELVASREAVRAVRAELARRGAYLPPLRDRDPVGPHRHPRYRDFRLMLSRGLALGGYENDPKLDSPATALSYLYLLSNVLQRFFGEVEAARALVSEVGSPAGPLTREVALELTERAACALGRCGSATAEEIAGLVTPALPGELSRGDSYALAAALIGTFGDGARPEAAER